MPSVEERVAMIEGQVQQLPHMFSLLRADLARMDGRLDSMETRLDERFARLDDRMSRQFTWMVGIQITTLVAVISAVIGALLART